MNVSPAMSLFITQDWLYGVHLVLICIPLPHFHSLMDMYVVSSAFPYLLYSASYLHAVEQIVDVL